MSCVQDDMKNLGITENIVQKSEGVQESVAESHSTIRSCTRCLVWENKPESKDVVDDAHDDDDYDDLMSTVGK